MVKVVAYLDESADERADEVYYCAVIVKYHQAFFVRRELDQLRLKIHREMRDLGYPIFRSVLPYNMQSSHQRAEHARIQAGEIIEFHTAHIWHRTGAFFLERPEPHGTYKRHLSWIEEFLKIIIKYRLNIRTVYSNRTNEMKSQISDFRSTLREYYGNFLHPSVKSSKGAPVAQDIFVSMMSGMVKTLQSDGAKFSWEIEIKADKGKRNEIFRGLNLLEIGRQYGFYNNISDPVFLDSESDSIIQLADAVALIERYAKTLPENHVYLKDAQYLFKKYINPRAILGHVISDPTNQRMGYILSFALSVEITFLHSGGIQKTLLDRQRYAKAILHQIYSRYSLIKASESRDASIMGPSEEILAQLPPLPRMMLLQRAPNNMIVTYGDDDGLHTRVFPLD